MRIMQKLRNALSPLVSTDDRGLNCVYPNTLPQAPVYPAIVYQFISNLPAAGLTQAARYTDFHAQITLHATDYASLLNLRASVLTAVEAMPEHETRELDIEGPYEFEPKAFNWILGYHFRDAES